MDHPISINWSCSSPFCDPSMQQTLFFHPPTCRLRDAARSLPLRNALAPNISLAPLDSAYLDLTSHLSPSDSLQLAAGVVRCLRIAMNFFMHDGNRSKVSSGGIVTVLWDGWPSSGGVILRWREYIFSVLKRQTRLWDPQKLLLSGQRWLFPRRCDVKLTVYLYPVLRSRIPGVIPLLPLYAFKTSIQTTLCYFWVLARNYLLTLDEGSRLLRNVVSKKNGTVRLTNRTVERSPCEMSAITQHAASVSKNFRLVLGCWSV